MNRSYLFVPATQPVRIKKALDSHADAVIIDLEDAVPVSEKENARNNVINALKELSKPTKSIYLRINDLLTAFWRDDVSLLKEYPFAGIVLAKTKSGEDVIEIEKYVPKEQHIIPLIENAEGVLSAKSIAGASNRIKRLAFGAIDYSLELGINLSTNQEELIYPRSVIAVASKAHGLQPPIDTVYTEFKNQAGLIHETNLGKQQGFYAKLCIHPNQTTVVNQIFTPTSEEIQWAKELVVAFEEAELEGSAAIQLNGKMVDYPVYKQALQVIERIPLK
ncbi:HpcH/HpaI aldolase/citrate lyase family protein [Robertmurraya kyonggiensis]|uniref:CoA ester lyase n=1 Tax=Robertmurraya kyonggiensis TaxID=1037680 RepID=A0A4U1DDE6_9BACI|nr:CoA ester lyase [Robertmurraya kyonggiensis]TKC19456.1 CoA ester lyase [Robertmurraya kyonggiensis]